MKTIHFIFGCHSHQPVGNFEFVFRQAYEQAYRPFLDVLERFPAVRVTQHFSGPLLDWFESEEPAFLERLGALVRSGQIEIMGGAYYEPLLSAIPERDSIAQIRWMAEFCERHFGAAPKGMWVAERVWEPHMPRILGRAGIEYTAVDDTHFLCAGLDPNSLFGYYMTEDEGYAIKVFPILARLRYTIPFQQVFKTIDFLREHATEDGLACAVLHDDGEKFGVWPETFRSVYEEGWLEAFFQALTDNRDWLRATTYSEYLRKAPALGRVYLPTASYHEMMEWALPTPMQRRLRAFKRRLEQAPDLAPDAELFVRGSFWRSFLAKYPEANNVQKKMLRVSGRLDRLRAGKNLRGKGAARLREAERLLYQGQCNCAYWHGVFGGLYLNHLRTALYEKLIAAETVLDGLSHKDDRWVRCERLDFDADGNEDAVLENAQLALAFNPADGGTLFEWDYKAKPFNFANTLARREEAYHELLHAGRVQAGETAEGAQSIHDLVRVKEPGLEDYLVYDPYRRTCLRDHFLAPDARARDLWAGTYAERGDFATARYELETGRNRVTMWRDGQAGAGGARLPVRVKKTVMLAPGASRFEIRYDVAFGEPLDATLVFGVEFNINLLSGSAFDRYYRSDDVDLHHAKLGEMGCDEGLTYLALRDDWQQLECGFRFDAPARIYRFPVETVSQSEGGQERVYQGSTVIPCWRVEPRTTGMLTWRIVAEVVST